MKKILALLQCSSVYISLVIIILVQVFFLLFNKETYGGADNVQHFQIAHYAFKYPHLFLDLWGKPIYTLFVAPFTLFGYTIAKGFNLIVAVLTLLLTARLSEKMIKGSAVIVIWLIAFSPVYFFLMDTCLTEVLFSLVLVASVYLFYENKYVFSTLILSLIPFVRSEGLVLFPVFIIAYFIRKSYWQILLLSFGTILFSLIGFFIFGDLFWIFHRFPYSMEKSIYGSGSLLHFVTSSPFIFGVPFIIVLLIGLGCWIYQVFHVFSLKDENLVLFILIVGSFWIYFGAHSYVWWKGTGGSLGLTRVIGGVIPLAGIIAAKSIELISAKIRKKFLAKGLLFMLVLAQVFMLFKRYELPLKQDPVDKLISKCSDYLRQYPIEGKFFYFNPQFIFYLDIDPYDQSKCNWGVADKLVPSNSMNFGDIIVWDAHFGSNEGGIQLNVLENDNFLEEVKTFLPVEKIKVLGGYDYSVRIYKKVEQKKTGGPVKISGMLNKTLTFEEYLVPEVVSIDSIKVWEMNSKQEFSPNIVFPINEIANSEFLKFKVELQFKALDLIQKDQVLLVLSVDNGDEHIRYEKKDLISDNNNSWQKLEMDVEMPATIPNTAKVAVYVWNKDKKHFYFKNIIVNLSSY